MVDGLFPKEERISWEGHLAGMGAGLIAVLVYGKRPFSRKKSGSTTIAIQPDVTQRHVSNTFVPYYMHYTINYCMHNGDKTAEPFIYSLKPDSQPGQKPTLLQHSASVKEQKKP